MRPVDRGEKPTRPDGSLIHYKEYGDMRTDLITRIGEYCSYCEVPLGVNLAIEHMLSKVFSINEIDWNNSLLACTNCNSHKSAATTSELDLDNYYWPSIQPDAAPKNTFDMLHYHKANLSLQALIDGGLLSLPKNREGKSYVQATYNMVWIAVNPTFLGTSAEQKIKKTIRLTGLNDHVPEIDNPKVSDRRIINRTLAWDRALLAANALQKYYLPHNTNYNSATDPTSKNRIMNEAANDPSILVLKNQIKALAIATGFWSIWVTIFKDPTRTFINDQVRNALICELLIKPFPGTYIPFSNITACP